MSNAVDREGQFRGTITEYGLKEMESGSVAVSIKAQLTEFYAGEEEGWLDWTQYDVEAQGDVWVIKRDKSLNAKAAESLVKNAGWDGSFTSVKDGSWQPTPCQFTVKAEEYEGRTYYKIAFVNDFDRTPGGMSNVDDARVKSLESQYGSQMRALFSNTKRNGAKPEASKPRTPPGPSATQQKAAREAEAALGADEIPF